MTNTTLEEEKGKPKGKPKKKKEKRMQEQMSNVCNRHSRRRNALLRHSGFSTSLSVEGDAAPYAGTRPRDRQGSPTCQTASVEPKTVDGTDPCREAGVKTARV